MERMVISDIEGKALRERVTELGSEGISIKKAEMKTDRAAACCGLSLSR
jgi:hypothetical protein